MNKLKNKKPEDYFAKIVSELRGFAIFMMDTEGIIISWNLGCEMIKGFRPEEAIGNHFEMLFPDFLREANYPQQELEHAYIHGRYESENWRRQKSGELFWAHVVLTKVLDDDGEFVGFIKITQDYTVRKKYEDDLKIQKESLQKVNKELEKAKEDLIANNSKVLFKKNKELTKINQDLDLFVYTASHDLRTPISNMEGLLNIISENHSFQDSKLKPLLDMMSKSIEKLKKTIHELTEIGKVQNSELDEEQNNALYELIEEVKFSLKELISESNAKIMVKIESCSDIRFSTKNLRSILYNLVSNGIKYAAPERTPEILIKTTVEDNYCVLIVKDNGLGISPENQEKLFTKFKRFHDHVEGTGIGLYMVKRIVDNAGGKIEIDSELGKGSTFKIYFKA